MRLLRSVPFFASLEAGRLKLLAFSSEHIGFEDGEIVFREGSSGEDVYFILEGGADVLTEKEGREFAVARLPRYSLFGEISALCDVPRTATIRAAGELTVLRIPKDYFLQLIVEQPAAALQLIRVLARRVAATTADLVAALQVGAPD
jgi:CRP-like cAMP-binding protein